MLHKKLCLYASVFMGMGDISDQSEKRLCFVCIPFYHTASVLCNVVPALITGLGLDFDSV